MNKRFLGIDPGLNGFIAIVTGKKIESLKMPILTMGKKKVLDINKILLLFQKIAPTITMCILEQQQVRHQQSAMSGFTTGEGFGILKGLLIATKVPFEILAPNAWKKKMNVVGTGKNAADKKKDTKLKSILKAKQLYPGVNLIVGKRSRKEHDGKAEAILLATLAKRMYYGRQ